jgi:hypothetical protein
LGNVPFAIQFPDVRERTHKRRVSDFPNAPFVRVFANFWPICPRRAR